ncbi:hypothetical protein KJ763_02035 [Patescibacteria group bacterium]|nr:hypothetical protein [Patescibacteria group bacterium]
MINLLPSENKIKIKKEYLNRIIIIFGFSLLVLIFIAGVFLCLLFYLISIQKTNSEESFLLSQKEANLLNEKETSELIESVNFLSLRLVNGQKNTKETSQIIKTLILLKNDGIIIKSFSFSNAVGGSGREARISGKSKTRTELMNFIENIKKDNFFAEVNSPLSNFLKEENMDFNFSIKIANYEK